MFLKFLSFDNIFKTHSLFLLYQIKDIGHYIEVFVYLGLAFVHGDRCRSLCIILHLAITFVQLIFMRCILCSHLYTENIRTLKKKKMTKILEDEKIFHDHGLQELTM